MSTLHLSDWPSADSFGATADHLHAFGAVSLTYNRLEYNMSRLFDFILGDHANVSEAIFDRLSNRDRIDVLRTVVHSRTFDLPISERLLHSIHCFELCTENRNTLMHIVHDHQIEPQDVLLGKKKNSNKTRENFYELPVASIRKIADEMRFTNEFVARMSTYIFVQWLTAHEPREGEEIIRAAVEKAGPIPLPDKPPQPDKLSPRLLDQV